jgi:HSP20 family molecular chaperone IbpA
MSIFNLIPSVNRAPALRGGDTNVSVPAVKPGYRVREQADNFEVTVLLPGVAKENLEITAENGAVTIGGQRSWKQPSHWTPLYRETSDARYELTLTHDNSIDVDNIRAELRDGVLRVTLPKSEAVKPRKIAVG